MSQESARHRARLWLDRARAVGALGVGVVEPALNKQP